MDITESELSISLQEALTCYLAYLSRSQKLRESRLPHQGKGVETVGDLVTQVNYQSRVAASETCLQYTGRIARRVRRWHHHSEESYGDEEKPDESDSVEVDMDTFCWFLEGVPEDPFLDPFSGRWIGPTDACAGPCPKNEAVNDRAQNVVETKVGTALFVDVID
jgi:hypothetical protein